MHVLDPSTWKAEAGGSFQFEARLVYRVPGQPWLCYIKKPSQKENKKKSKKPQVNEKESAASLKSPMTLSNSTTIRSMVPHGFKHCFLNPLFSQCGDTCLLIPEIWEAKAEEIQVLRSTWATGLRPCLKQ